MKILVVDHEKVQRANLVNKLRAHGHHIDAVADCQQATDQCSSTTYDLAFIDTEIPGGGMALLEHLRQQAGCSVDVVMMSVNGEIPLVVRAIKLGAVDFVTKPVPTSVLRPLLKSVEQDRCDDRPSPRCHIDVDEAIIGQTSAIQRVKRLVRIAARTDANVLIHGETGVGKDLLASVIHGTSHRSQGPFVKVGCTQLAPALIESELYGHEEGAFTGAGQPRPGRFALAETGTIYLDDVDDISLEQQTKLLRVIEEKVFERVGGIELIKANVRVIASTKLNLLDKVADGTFRQDLYYRLDVLRLRVPPLRARRDDIPALTDHLLKRIAPDQPREIEPAAIDVLCQHDWPGNVRELYHALERAWLMSGGRITADILRADVLAGTDTRSPATGAGPSTLGFKAAMDHAERQLLVNALEHTGGNKTAAAESLGMKPSTFRDRLAKHGLP